MVGPRYDLLMRVLHLSDLHLSEHKPRSHANALAILPAVRDAKPDLVVITGDLTHHGRSDPAEFNAVLTLLHQLPCPCLTVPGNHDVGNFTHTGSRDSRVTAQRIDSFCEALGHDRFAHDQEGWQLLGLNAMLLGSGLAREADQLHWLTHALINAQRQRRRVALFLHAPVFLLTPDAPLTAAQREWCPPDPARHALWQLCNDHDVSLIASGHVHQNRMQTFARTTVSWSPAVSGSQVTGPAFPADVFHAAAAPLYHFTPAGLSVEHLPLPLQTHTTFVP